MTISLPPEWQKFIEEKVSAGQYSDANAVVVEALRAVRDREARLESLRREIQVGVDQADRGELSPWDPAQVKAEGRRLLQERRGQQQR